MSKNLTAKLALVAFLAVGCEARAQEPAPTCNPNTGRATARIACLHRITQALSDQIDALQARLADNVKRADLSDYMRRSEVENAMDGYVKYNAPLAISAAGEPNVSQSDRRCIAADIDAESVVLDKSCNFEARPEFRWQLLPAMKSSAQNR